MAHDSLAPVFSHQAITQLAAICAKFGLAKTDYPGYELSTKLSKKAWLTLSASLMLAAVTKNGKDKVKLRSQAIAIKAELQAVKWEPTSVSDLPEALAKNIEKCASGGGCLASK